MRTEPALWAASLAVPPGAVLLAYALGLRGRRLQTLGAACASALTLAASLPLALPAVREAAFLGHPLGPLPAALVPFEALLWLLTVLVTPSSRLNDASLARTAGVCALTMAGFLTASPWLLTLFWAGTAAIYAAGHAEAGFERARRLAAATMGLSTILLAAGVLTPGPVGAALVLAAAAIRTGVLPFHAWIPEVFDHGRIGPAAMFCAPQMGTYVALVLAVPRAPEGLTGTFAVLGLATSLYAALLALHQNEARRACGYLFVSQSALVFAGIDLPNREALVGAMLLWVSSGLALSGLTRCVLVLEARRGRLRLDRLHGGYERMPVLAACFLILGLAVMGFPATLGFVGEEMLVRGAVESFPSLGLTAVAASAVTGLVVLRMYFSLFCGRREAGIQLSPQRSEKLGFGLAAMLLVGFGLAPGRLVRLLDRVGEAALARRTAVPPAHHEDWR